jgi:hypothetical protein
MIEKTDGPEALMFGRYPRDCSVRNHSYEGVVMKTIDKATIEQYQKDQWSWRMWLALALTLIIAGVPVMYFSKPWGNLAFYGGLAVLFIGAFRRPYQKGLEERQASWQYKFLERWERYSGKSVSEFPTTHIGVKFLERWAINELAERAEELNQRYSREEDFYRQEKEIDWDNLDPQEGIKIKEDRTWREEYMKSHIQQAKRSFLDFWDLITEKDGIGLLAGPEWQDPEAFRQKVLARGFTYKRIGLLDY